MPFIFNAKGVNSCTSLPFVVDTDSAISILQFSEKYAASLRPTDTVLSSASGHPIICCGELESNIVIPSSRRIFQWSFVVADVVNSILCTDFLSRHALIIDCANRLLIDSTTNCNISLDRSHKLPELYNIHLKNFDERTQQIIEKYPKVTHPM